MKKKFTIKAPYSMRRTMYNHLDWICLIIYAMPISHDKPWEIKKGLLLQLKALV